MLNINNLKLCFEGAKKCNQKYMGIRFESEDSLKPEIRVIKSNNFDLDYYIDNFSYNLVSNTLNKVRITGFTFGNSVNEINRDLLGDINF